MASSSSGEYVSRYDVFLSFRGEDTRETFTDHLYDRLTRAGIYTFRDNNSIRIGEDLKPEFERGIRESRASIIILSKEYATSRWCLDELYLIILQRMDRNHFVLPVFYHVDPSHVRKQEGTFQINIKPDTKWTKDNVERWKAALHLVGNIAGKVASGSEVEFSQEIVNIITTELNLTQVYRQLNLVGMETRDKEINNWLEQSDGEILAIWGIDGGGKTTLARHIVYSNWQKFESVSILEDIGGTSTEALRQLQEKLSRDIIEGKEKTIPSVCQGTYTIQNALKKRKAIIVLDNIVTKEQVDMLLGSGSETETDETKVRSKIIITTTEKNASKWFRSTSWRCKEHEMKLLDEGESLKLLKHHAFEPNVSMEGYDELVKRALVYCQGYPLALKVCGSFLYCDSSHSSESRKQFWESMMTSLERQVPDSIQSVLKTSYNSLQLHSVKELFLHIACFFNGKDNDYVQKILEPEYYAKSGIVTLTNSCLLSVSSNNELRMHPLIQEMGRTIILAESPRLPGERSRIWRDKESYEVLSKGNGSTKVEGLALNMEMLRQQSDKGRRKPPDSVKTDSIGKMNNLKLLQLNQLELTGSYENILKDLRWLCWRESHLKTIPQKLHMEKLVAIDMSRSKLKVFELPNVLPILKILNLTDSHDLVEIQNISRFPNLETLILVHCRKLVRVSDTLGDLTGLTLLDITGCEKLCMGKQPKSYERIKVSLFGGQNTKQPHLLLPNSLRQLLLKDCYLKDTHYFPLSLKNQSQLEYLNLAVNQFELLPCYTHLNNLRVLDLSGCRALKILWCLPRKLAELYIFYCDSLKSVTFESHKYTLQEFRYEGCVNLLEVEDFFKFVPVAMLTEADLGHMNWLRAYQDLEVCMVGDEDLTQGRSLCLQMLYEFNIMSISLPDIEKPNIIPEYEYTSDDPLLSFKVPERSSNRTLKGLNMTFKYTIQGDEWVWFAKIRTNKGVDLIYNPKAFGKPAADKVGIWLSYWPIGNSLHDGDEVNVDIVVTKGLEIKGCGASLVYTDEEDEIESFEDSKESIVDANESFEDKDESFEEKNADADILGADISGFKLSYRTYYLCRRDYSQLMEVGRLNPNWFNNLVDYKIQNTEIGGWRKTGRPNKPYQSFTELKNIRCTIYGPQSNEFYTIEELTKSSLVDKAVEFTSKFSDKTTKCADISESMESTSSSLTESTKYSGPLVRNSAGKKVVLKVKMSGDRDKKKVMKAAISVTGVDSVAVDMEDEKLTVIGDFDPMKIVSRLRKIVATDFISVGPVNFKKPQKEDKGKLLSVDKNSSNVSADSDLSGKSVSNVPAYFNSAEMDKDQCIVS